MVIRPVHVRKDGELPDSLTESSETPSSGNGLGGEWMTPERTVVLGIDGLDAEFLTQNLQHLPSLARVAQFSGIYSVSSVFPPDSDTAWATIYTGLTPAQHGILHMENPLIKSARLASSNPPSWSIRGRTLWDRASRTGLKCAVVFPHLGFPAWPIRGLMISRSSLREGFSVTGTLPRPDLLRPEHHTIKSFPRRGREDQFLEMALDRVTAEKELFTEVLDFDEWDFFFAYSSTLDLVEHFLWPSAGTPDAFDGGEYLRRAYQACDEMVSAFITRLRPEDRLFIVSDHGHGPRPATEFRLIAYLQDHVNQKPAKKDKSPSRRARVRSNFLGFPLRILLQLMEPLDLRDPAHQILRRYPILGSLIARFGSPPQVSPFHLTLGSPIKAYSYGGVDLNDVEGQNADDAVAASTIVDLLREARGPDGLRLFEWVSSREEIDAGPFLPRFPEVLFQLREKFAASETLDPPFLGPHRTSNLVPGSHRRMAAFLCNDPKVGGCPPENLKDVHHLIALSLSQGTLSPQDLS